MPALDSLQHEAFAQARFAGKSLEEAHEAAGLGTGVSRAQSSSSASRLARLPEIRERIAELYRERVAAVTYDKAAAVRDLLTILHTPPSESDEQHPLCEVRMGRDGAYHRLPSKLQAMSRLIKLMGWDDVPKVERSNESTLDELIADIRQGKLGREKSAPLNRAPQATKDDDAALEKNEEPAPENEKKPEPEPEPISASSPLPPQQEAYAVARIKGMGVKEAYAAATGNTGESAILAWRMNDTPEVKARIKALRQKIQEVTRYKKEDAVRDLVVIVLSSPADAGPNHPLCERRKTSWGEYHRFPSKLSAILLLSRMLGWQHEDLELPDPDATYDSWTARVKQRRREALASAATQAARLPYSSQTLHA